MTKTATKAAPAAMPVLLTAIGEELRHLANAVERLHDVVSLPGVKVSLQDAEAINVVQGIDHVTQHLAALSEFLATIATDVPEHWSLDTASACDSILIASLSQRLRRPHEPRPSSAANDDCEFF